MQVIFTKDLRGQGKKDEVKIVKDGYAENFLIKKGYAIAVTESNLAKLKREHEETLRLEEEYRQTAKTEKLKLEKEELEFKVKTGEHDRVFGSVSAKQIKEALDKKGYKIDKKQIKLEDNMSFLGFHQVNIELYKEVIASIKVQLVK